MVLFGSVTNTSSSVRSTVRIGVTWDKRVQSSGHQAGSVCAQWGTGYKQQTAHLLNDTGDEDGPRCLHRNAVAWNKRPAQENG
jgi:hypothetical protein